MNPPPLLNLLTYLSHVYYYDDELFHKPKDVDQTKSLDAFEADRSIVELKEEIGHGEFGRYV